jgi:30S ribosomal protein S31
MRPEVKPIKIYFAHVRAERAVCETSYLQYESNYDERDLNNLESHNSGRNCRKETGGMGKGDKRSRRGKIVNGSYGARRPHRDARSNAAPRKAPVKRAQPR